MRHERRLFVVLSAALLLGAVMSLAVSRLEASAAGPCLEMHNCTTGVAADECKPIIWPPEGCKMGIEICSSC